MSPKTVDLFVKTPSFLYKNTFTHLISYGQTIWSWPFISFIVSFPMLSGLKSDLHRSCVDHAEGLEFGIKFWQTLGGWHSWKIYNVPVCEWNELFGKIPGARCVRYVIFWRKMLKTLNAASHCNNCKRNLLLLPCKKTQSPGERQKAYRHFYTLFVELEQVVEGFYNGISTAEVDTLAAETCAYMYLDLDHGICGWIQWTAAQWILWDLNREYHFWILNPIESPSDWVNRK